MVRSRVPIPVLAMRLFALTFVLMALVVAVLISRDAATDEQQLTSVYRVLPLSYVEGRYLTVHGTPPFPQCTQTEQCASAVGETLARKDVAGIERIGANEPTTQIDARIEDQSNMLVYALLALCVVLEVIQEGTLAKADCLLAKQKQILLSMYTENTPIAELESNQDQRFAVSKTLVAIAVVSQLVFVGTIVSVGWRIIPVYASSIVCAFIVRCVSTLCAWSLITSILTSVLTYGALTERVPFLV